MNILNLATTSNKSHQDYTILKMTETFATIHSRKCVLIQHTLHEQVELSNQWKCQAAKRIRSKLQL